MVSTIASLIRDNGAAIRTLAESLTPDGKRYLHREILERLGLPTSTAHVREVSKFLNRSGIRRRTYTSRAKAQPDGGLLPAETPAPDAPVTMDTDTYLAICAKLTVLANRTTDIITAGREVVAALESLVALFGMNETPEQHD